MTTGWKASQLKRPSFAPRHWGGWVMVSFLWVLGHLPRKLGYALVSPLGALMRLALGSRRRIAEQNIALCFPELDEAGQHQLLKDSFRAMARMLPEMAGCWAGRPRNALDIAELRGLESLEVSDKGLLIVTAHVTSLEIGARTLGSAGSGYGIYRPLGNPVMEWYQNRGRTSYAKGMISKRDMRRAIRYLKDGGNLWYAPDQDFGPRHSVFTPFFGIETATLLMTRRLPQLTGCRVRVMMPRYDVKADRYVVELTPPLENFPSDDPVADLTRINALMEEGVRKAPEQYLWVHRRFKTRPTGEPDIYGADGRPGAVPVAGEELP